MRSLAEKVGQLLVVGFQGLTAPDYILDGLATGKIGGVILFARNVESPSQLAALCKQLHETAMSPILIAIDQEGGMVARLRAAQGFTESAGAMAISAALQSAALSESMSQLLADEMRSVGINWNYAPVLDIAYNAANPTIGTRSYGSDSQHVSQLAVAATRGFQAGGVAACAKHFPGIGNTAIDTHEALAVLDTPLEQVMQHDLVPYQAVIEAGIASIMTTHTVFTALDKDYPATLSAKIIKPLLRERLNFQGVITTDCLEMKAISANYGAGEAAVLAILAGVDIVLMSHTRSMQEEAYHALLEAAESGRISMALIDAANERIAKLKAEYAIEPSQIDPSGVNNVEHQAQALEAAKAGIVMYKNQWSILPLNMTKKIALIEFASQLESAVLERNENTAFGSRFQAQGIRTIVLSPTNPSDEDIHTALKLAQAAELTIIATRNAHLLPRQAEIAKLLQQASQNAVHLCLQDPYDANLLNAEAILCTCGDSVPSLQAAYAVLFGEFNPHGKLPVRVD